MASSACRRIAGPSLRLDVLQTKPEPEVFNAAFVERRMRQHSAWREQEAEFLARQIVREVEAGILAKLEYARTAANALEPVQ
jgi:hypothetical protein